MDSKDFFNKLHILGGIATIDLNTIDMLAVFQPKLSEEVKIVIGMYLSLVGDGNTCMKLDVEGLSDKWMQKWKGLVLAADLDEETAKDYILDEAEIKNTINTGIASISGCSKIVGPDKLFKIKDYNDGKWLFTTKFSKAVESVSECLKRLFKQAKIVNIESEKNLVITYFKKNAQITLNDKQAEAIVRGQKENLVITGGPGYGKTTVVCYLLWKLMENDPDKLNWPIYLAAPSGKAQDRLKESINEELKRLKNVDNKIFNKLTGASSYTIHRLLNYKPSTNAFAYNKDNQFDAESIFVIDEASMIDINIFKSLLEAIPDGAKVFMLGDPYQLPSVQAGAVLGDILDSNNKIVTNIVELDQSNRFAAGSTLGNLATIIKARNTVNLSCSFEEWNTEKDKFDLNNESKDYPVKYISLHKINLDNLIEDRKVKSNQLDNIVSKWTKAFFNIASSCSTLEGNTDEKELEKIWGNVSNARVLCAERRGKVGVESLNKLFNANVMASSNEKGEYFPGQQLIITQNQKMFDLYNGDCGIVVSFKDKKAKYLMLEKPVANTTSNTDDDDSIIRIGRFLFYPIHIIPKESMELAYAITVHKSQGSGYSNILVFIPEKEGHPLLNNQIIYTAVTRSKGCTYIVGTEDTLKKAIRTQMTRDTKIGAVMQ